VCFFVLTKGKGKKKTAAGSVKRKTRGSELWCQEEGRFGQGGSPVILEGEGKKKKPQLVEKGEGRLKGPDRERRKKIHGKRRGPG